MTIQATPLVSVLIPTYQYARYLPAAIDSVLQQTLRDIEILVVDDASSDGTVSILERYTHQDRRLRWQRNSTNLGMVANANRCLAQARGSYIKFLMADDLLLAPDALARMVAPLVSDPSVSLVACARQIIDDKTRPQDIWCHWPDHSVIAGVDVIRRSLVDTRNYIGEPTATMFRRTQSGRGFNVYYHQIVDLEMWFHLLEQGSMAYIAEPLCAFRIHPHQQTVAARAQALDVLDQQRLFSEYLGNPAYRFTPEEQWFMGYRLIRQFQRRARRTGEGRNLMRTLLQSYGRFRFLLDYPRYRFLKYYLPRRSAPPSRT
jgi:glycosyltransferase involved in cell wall biosynthesis